MKLHFISTGDKFPYTYYIGVMTALKKFKGDVVLHIIKEPDSEYYNLLKKETALHIKSIEVDMSLPVFSKEFNMIKEYTPNMEKNWKHVLMFDYLMWGIMAAEGGVIKGLDSILIEDYQHLLSEDKEMLVCNYGPNIHYALMDGCVVKPGSLIAKQIFEDIKLVMQGIEPGGATASFVDGKYRWGGAGVIPFRNRIECDDKVLQMDLRRYTRAMFSSSTSEHDEELIKIAESILKMPVTKNSEKVFERVYKTNAWGGSESRSGPGSGSWLTRYIKVAIKDLISEYKISSILDCACGDFNWMKDVVGGTAVDYLGVDIVRQAIEDNNKKYNFSNCKFQKLDILEDTLPKSDLVLCRDCLVHLPFEDVFKFIDNFLDSGSQYLLTTSFTGDRINAEFDDGICGWCPINFQKEPFNFPPPQKIIVEKFLEGDVKYKDKSLLLWSRDQLLCWKI